MSVPVGPTVRGLFSLKPGDADHIPALRNAVALAVPLLLLLWLDRMDIAIFVSLGSFTSLFARGEPTVRRVAEQARIGVLLTGCVAVGAVLAHARPLLPGPVGDLLAIALPALMASVAAVLTRAHGIRPGGGVFPLFACGAVVVVGQSTPILLAIALAGASAAWCVLLSALWHYLGEANREHGAKEIAPLAPGELRGTFGLHLTAASLGGLGGLWSGLPSIYWAQMAAVVPLAAQGGAAQFERGVHRVFGTLIGILATAFLLSFPSQHWQLVVWVVIAQFLTEFVVLRNYSLALLFITPMALLMVQMSHPQPVRHLLEARAIETLIGVAVGLFVAGVAVLRRRRRARGIDGEPVVCEL